MKNRIYVCHTYYHAFITFLKELSIREREKDPGEAVLVLSSLSTDFTGFIDRAAASGLFREVVEFPEKRFTEITELRVLSRDRGSIFSNMIQRIQFTKRYAEIEDQYVPDILREQGYSIYVYCDSDPVGTWLNQKHIRYHAVEDGLNCLAHFDTARYDNRKAFALKAFMSRKLNLIFIQNGYGKYCMDMEVNDLSAIALPPIWGAVYREVPRAPLYDRLKPIDKVIIRDAFLPELDKKLLRGKGTSVLLLTEAHRPSEMLITMYTDIVNARPGAKIFIKPHPMDETDYSFAFPDAVILPGKVPMEVLKLVPRVHFSEVITIYTDLTMIDFADKKTRLGSTFMDRYEDHSLHDLNDGIGVNTDRDDPL
ncbi:MAG: glycosyltransferase family 52 protein [Lachnospiraceae bacterium]|nr:glycosyltransferase family 52 protein [Lachnospiraceae bacterium]